MAAHLSGFCGTDAHESCRALSENGVKAESRYSLCRCECHDGDETLRAALVSTLKGWAANAPETASMAALQEYVEHANTAVRAAAAAVTD